MCVCYTPVVLQFKCLLRMTFSITLFQHWVNACRVWCTGSWFVHDGVYVCVSPHHIYSYWHFNTSACCNMGKRYPPHDLMNCCMVLFGSYTAGSRHTIYDWCSSRKMRSRILHGHHLYSTGMSSSLSVEC